MQIITYLRASISPKGPKYLHRRGLHNRNYDYYRFWASIPQNGTQDPLGRFKAIWSNSVLRACSHRAFGLLGHFHMGVSENRGS